MLRTTSRSRPLLLLLLAASACAGGRAEPPETAAAPAPVPAAPGSSPVVVGEKAPELSVASCSTPGNAAVTPGHVGLVVFWATWNAPSRHAFPKLDALQRAYGARGLQIAALSVDDDNVGCLETNGWGNTCLREGDVVAQAAREWGATFPVGWDAGRRVATRWAPPSMPMAYVVDRQGIVRHAQAGWQEGSGEELEQKIVPLL